MQKICEVAESLGPCTARQIDKHAGLPDSFVMSRLCRRLVDHGMMVVDESEKPVVYRVVDDWRDKIKIKSKKAAAVIVHKRLPSHILQGVWG
jgi:hypothetical protein